MKRIKYKNLTFFRLFVIVLAIFAFNMQARLFDEFQYRESYWRHGWRGFITITNFDGGGSPPVTLIPEKFPLNTHLIRYGVPFDLPEEPDEILYTGVETKDSVSVSISEKTTEIFMLISADFPDKIPLYDPFEKFMRRTVLDDPEQVCVEIVYSDGSSDHFIPANMRKPSYGIENGLGLYVIHPDKNKKPITLILHDRMKTAAFGIWAITLNTRKPIAKEPEQTFPHYRQLAKKTTPASMSVKFNLANGLSWESLESKVWGKKINFTNSPVFSIAIKQDGSNTSPILHSTDFSVVHVKQNSNSYNIILSFKKDDISLLANFSFIKTNTEEIQLDLNIYNDGTAPLKANIKFPIINGILFRDWDDTWYVSPAFGGIINNVSFNQKVRFGENHPMQFDGFFSPYNGGGLMIMTRDFATPPKVYNIGKTNNGCFYSIEYENKTLMPSEAWNSSPIIISSAFGDWKDQFRKYCQWTKHFTANEKLKPTWLKQSFVLISRNVEEHGNIIESLNQSFDKFALCDTVQICLGFDKSLEYINFATNIDKNVLTETSSNLCEKYLHAITNNHTISSNDKKNNIMPTNYFSKLFVLEQELNSITNAVNRLKEANIQFVIKMTENLLKPLPIDGFTNDKLQNQLILEHSLYLKECCSKIFKTVNPAGLCVPAHGIINPFYESDTHSSFLHSKRLNLHMILKNNGNSNSILISNLTPVDTSTMFFDACYNCILPGYISTYEKSFQNFMSYYSFRESVAPYYINLFRFAFPKFKIFSVAAPFSKEYWNPMKFIFFNGEALFLDESAVILADENDVDFINKIYRIYQKYSDAFLSDDIEPLVLTLKPGLFANKFVGNNYVLWTLYNASYKPLKGPLISVKHIPGANYKEILTSRSVSYKVNGSNAELTFSMMPRSIACIVQLKN